MWWLAVAVGLKLIYDAVSAEEINARKQWGEKRQQVERSIEEHRRNISEHISQARISYNFHFLVDLHYSSMKVADVAYRLLDDAGKSLQGMGKMLKRAKEHKISLQNNLDLARRRRDKAGIQDLIDQLKLVNNMRREIFDDRDRVIQQKNSLKNEVHRLNNQTAELKQLISARCGAKGRDWYLRLEERKRMRRIMWGR